MVSPTAVAPFAFCLCTLLLAVSFVSAVPPDAATSYCTLDGPERVFLCPDNGGTWPNPLGDFIVEVRDATGALVAPATVRVNVGGLSGMFIALCPGAITQRTTPTGIAGFNIPGSGCFKNRPVAVAIEAHDGSGSWVTIRQYHHVMSPDYAGWDDQGISGMWNGCVDPTDLAAFIHAYQSGTGAASCHDYDNDGVTGPTDLSVFAISYWGGTNCCP